MSIELLQNIINDFKIDKFRQFFREKNRRFKPNNETIDFGNKTDFLKDEAIGEITLEDGKLIIYSFQVKKELTERASKKIQYDIGKKLLKYLQNDAGIFIFYDKDNNFRFSLIYTDYLGIKREWSTFKRFTYYVSSELTNRTFLERIGIGEFSTLDNIKEAFSVEKVTKEFYSEFKEIFANAMLQIEGIEENKYDYVMLVFNRLLFLKFLEKKGWLDYNKNYLNDLFAKYKANKKANNFYNNYLYYLFFHSLNNTAYKGDLPHAKGLKDLLGIVPFLNGGLFEMAIFENPNIKIKDNLFNSVFKFFSRYNFTVTENTPMDIEVAVDPEMLGKVFEKLINSPEEEASGKNRRRETGSYYTPRPIVEYMCRESLKNYLANILSLEGVIPEYINKFVDKDDVSGIKNPEYVLDILRNVKICDPACGSGAFLVQMLHELVRLRRSLFKYDNISSDADYERKLQIIQNNLYGTDIQNFACEIAMLRFWLSLMVDYGYDFKDKMDFEKNVKHIPSLPNLSYKIKTGDSLVEQYGGKIPPANLLYNLLGEAKFQPLLKKLILLKNKYLVATGVDKIMYDKEIKSINIDLRKQIISILKGDHKAKDNCIYWETEFAEVMTDKKGFDVIIGNPPYGIVYDMSLKRVLEGTFSSFRRNNDIYVAFFERCVTLLNNNSSLVLITPNTYLNGDYFKRLREILKNNGYIVKIIDFKENSIFDDPTVFVSIFSFSKNRNIHFPYKFQLTTHDLNNKSQEVSIKSSDDSSLIPINDILEKTYLVQDVSLLDEFCLVKDVGFNYWTIGKGKKRDGDSIGDRILYTGKQLNSKDKSYLKGRDINRYYLGKPGSFLRHNYLSLLNRPADIFRFSEDILSITPKILYRQTAGEIIATMDYKKNLVDKTLHVIVPRGHIKIQMEYVLANLNSKLFNFFYRSISQETGARAFSQVKTTYIKKLPLRNVDIEIQNEISQIVKSILKVKENQPMHDISNFTNKIDVMIYRLYELTYDEAKIIDPLIVNIISKKDYDKYL